MVPYNPKNWFGLIFRFHKAETFRKLIPVMIFLAVYSFIICYIEIEVFKLEYASTTTVHSLLGFIISLLLVFRTNTAYDRWWEGRKQWGALVNVSRNLAFKVKNLIPKGSPRAQIISDGAAYYATVLRDHLRNVEADKIEALLPAHLKNGNIDSGHVPNEVANQMQAALGEAYGEHKISEAAYLAMMNDLNAFTDICGACERIKKTPIPYTYNIFIKKFIFLYTVTMPFGFVTDFGYWSIIITVFTLYALASLEMIAEEIEDPFGLDSNDLPTDDLAVTIYDNVVHISSGDYKPGKK